MTETYDSGLDSLAIQIHGWPTGRTVEAIDHGGAYFYAMVYLDTTAELIYAYGDTNSWTTQALTGVTSITSYDTADIMDCALAIDHNNDQVHIAWVADNKIWHMKCTNPDDPTDSANWQTYGAFKYQQVCNTSGNVKESVSICVDDSTGTANGSDDPHIVWSDDVTGTPDVYYNWGDGLNDLFTQAAELKIDDGDWPTITNIHNEGRRLYVSFMDSTGSRIDCIRHTVAATPLTLANWAGPINAVASTPDGVLNVAGGHSYIYRPLMTWYWDTDERVLFTAMSVGLGGATIPKSVIFLDNTSTLTPEHTVVGPFSNPTAIVNTLVQASDFRVIVQDDSFIYHSREAATGANDYEWDANSDWFKLATSVPLPIFLNAEWKGLEHADGALGYRRTHCVWGAAVNGLYFSEVRENTPISNAQNAPVDGAYKDETLAIDIVWDNTDLEVDGQTHFSLQVDDDAAFGSPIIDDSWSVSASTTRTITASTLAAEKTYYWRVRTRDGEKGDEQDPYSDEDWSTDLRYFLTGQQLEIEIDTVDQQSDGDVYIDMRMISPSSTNAELNDGVITDYAQYRTTGGSWTNMTVIVGECTITPSGPITTSPDPGTYYRLAWDANTDESSYEGLVDIRVRGEYDGDSEGMGFTEWVEFIGAELDTKGPVVTIGVPDGLTLAERAPTLHAAGTDYNDFEYAFEVDNNADFLSQEHQSGWQDENTYKVPSNLAAGVWYFRAQGRDKSVSQNTGSWDSGSFTIASGTYTGTILSDGTDEVSLSIINGMTYSIHNAVVEYDNIQNDYDETAIKQNIVEFRGRLPLEVSMTLFFNEGYESGYLISRLFNWQKDETKLILKDENDKFVTFGDDTYITYEPNRWLILTVKPRYNPARYRSIHCNIMIREVEP